MLKLQVMIKAAQPGIFQGLPITKRAMPVVTSSSWELTFLNKCNDLCNPIFASFSNSEAFVTSHRQKCSATHFDICAGDDTQDKAKDLIKEIYAHRANKELGQVDMIDALNSAFVESHAAGKVLSYGSFLVPGGRLWDLSGSSFPPRSASNLLPNDPHKNVSMYSGHDFTGLQTVLLRFRRIH